MNELLAEGHLKQPIDLSKLSKHDSAALNACIRSLLQKSKDDAAQREALLERSRTMVYEFDRTQGKLAKAEEKAHAEGKESELLASKLQQASRDLATERSMHAVCKENLQKSRNALANVKAIAAQDTKRRERETQAILQRWQKLASLPQHHSLDSSYQSTLRQSSSPVASSSNPEPKIELLNACLQDSEMARQELLEHNAGWRDAFSHAISSLSDTLSEYGIPIPPVSARLCVVVTCLKWHADQRGRLIESITFCSSFTPESTARTSRRITVDVRYQFRNAKNRVARSSTANLKHAQRRNSGVGSDEGASC